MSAIWISVIVVGLATMAIKAAGPLLLARRTPPPRAQAALEHLAPALLAALAVTETFGDDGALVLDEKALGVGVAAVALLLRAPVLVAVFLAALTAALARALG